MTIKPLFDSPAASPAAPAAPAPLNFPTETASPVVAPAMSAPPVAAAPAASLPAVAFPNDTEVDRFLAEEIRGVSRATSGILDKYKSDAVGGEDFTSSFDDVVRSAKELADDSKQVAKGGFFQRLFGSLKKAKERLLEHTRSVSQKLDSLGTSLQGGAQRERRRIDDLARIAQDNYDVYQRLKASTEQGAVQLAEWRAAYASLPVPADNMEAQQRNAIAARLDRFEKRLDDGRRAMVLAETTAAQLNGMDKTARDLINKFEDFIAMGLPSLKTALTLKLHALEQAQATAVVTRADDLLNETLRENATAVRVNLETAARANQRSLVDIETFEHVYREINAMYESTQRIQEEGRQRRQQEAPKIESMRGELLTRLQQTGVNL